MARFDTLEEVKELFDAFTKRGYNRVDTSRAYSPHAPGTSEPRIGAVAGGAFIIDTKVTSTPGSHTKEKILQEIDGSLKELKIEQINTEYLHQPDRESPFEPVCEAMNQAYKEGKIKQWGMSNYSPEEVQKFLDICEENNYVKPSVYQGHYNAVTRGAEDTLFPILRKNNMALYAYGPSAAGLFAGNHKNIQKGGRFDSAVSTFLSSLVSRGASSVT